MWVCLLVPGGWTTALVQAESSVVQEEQGRFSAFIGERFVRTELFFGSLKPDKTHVTDAEFKAFLRDVITPRFPEGLTLLTGLGQFLGASDEIIQERSRVLILLSCGSAAGEERKNRGNSRSVQAVLSSRVGPADGSLLRAGGLLADQAILETARTHRVRRRPHVQRHELYH
jgi:hypothetical protein